MDQSLITRAKRVGTVASPKNEKAHVQNGLENQTNLVLDYIATTPKKLSTAGLSAYWTAMMGRGGRKP